MPLAKYGKKALYRMPLAKYGKKKVFDKAWVFLPIKAPKSRKMEITINLGVTTTRKKKNDRKGEMWESVDRLLFHPLLPTAPPPITCFILYTLLLSFCPRFHIVESFW